MGDVYGIVDVTETRNLPERALAAHAARLERSRQREAERDTQQEDRVVHELVENARRVLGIQLHADGVLTYRETEHTPEGEESRWCASVGVDGMLIEWDTYGLAARLPCGECAQMTVRSGYVSSLAEMGEALAQHADGDPGLYRTCWACRRADNGRFARAFVTGEASPDGGPANEVPERTIEERLVAVLREMIRAEVDQA